MPSPFDDSAYFVFEQAFLVAAALAYVMILLLQLRAEDDKTPIGKRRMHRAAILFGTCLTIRCIDPRGRYSILPLPLLGFATINCIPAFAGLGSVFIGSALEALCKSTKQPVPKFIERSRVAAPASVFIVLNSLTIARFALPLEWLEAVCFFYVSCVLCVVTPMHQRVARNLQIVISEHLAKMSNLASNNTELLKSHHFLRTIRIGHGIINSLLCGILLWLGIQIVGNRFTQPTSEVNFSV